MRFASFVRRLLTRVGRDRPFTRREQLSLVMASHFGILAGVALIDWMFHLSSGLPGGFVLGEIVIIGMAAPFSISFPGLENLARLAAGPPLEPDDEEDEAAQKEAKEKKEVERLAGVVLILASIVQFAALASLLWGTGGPIESPFAEMTLIIAVFTPFIANNPRTIGIVLVASILYYAALISLYVDAHPPPEETWELALAIENDPSVWSYFAVNIMLLTGGIAFTVFESLLRSAEMAKAAEDAATRHAARNGEGAKDSVSKETMEDGADAENGAGADGLDGKGAEEGRDEDEDAQPA